MKISHWEAPVVRYSNMTGRGAYAWTIWHINLANRNAFRCELFEYTYIWMEWNNNNNGKYEVFLLLVCVCDLRKNDELKLTGLNSFVCLITICLSIFWFSGLVVNHDDSLGKRTELLQKKRIVENITKQKLMMKKIDTMHKKPPYLIIRMNWIIKMKVNRKEIGQKDEREIGCILWWIAYTNTYGTAKRWGGGAKREREKIMRERFVPLFPKCTVI